MNALKQIGYILIAALLVAIVIGSSAAIAVVAAVVVAIGVLGMVVFFVYKLIKEYFDSRG